MKKTSYTIEMVPAEQLEYLQKMNSCFTFTGEMLAFDDGTTYPIINSKHHHWTPTWFARHTKKGYVVSLWTKYILCKDGKIIDNDYWGGR